MAATWRQVERYRHPSRRADEGLATWVIGGEPALIYPAASSVGDLPLRGVIELDRPVRNVQGAAFVDATTLVCATDDPATDLWPVTRQLLQIHLADPLVGHDVAGAVTCLQALPMDSICPGNFETEGVDFDRSTGDRRTAIPVQPARRRRVPIPAPIIRLTIAYCLLRFMASWRGSSCRAQRVLFAHGFPLSVHNQRTCVLGMDV